MQIIFILIKKQEKNMENGKKIYLQRSYRKTLLLDYMKFLEKYFIINFKNKVNKFFYEEKLYS